MADIIFFQCTHVQVGKWKLGLCEFRGLILLYYRN